MNNKIVLDGEKIFKLVDSYGFPLWMVHELLREQTMFLNMKEFILAAKQSKNYDNPNRLRGLIFDNMLQHEDNEKIKIEIEKIVEEIYGTRTII